MLGILSSGIYNLILMSMDDKRKADMYRWIKIAGLLSFLPFVLVAGPLAGFYLGSFLEKRFGLPSYILIVFIIVGFIGSLSETIKIVKAALKAQDKG